MARVQNQLESLALKEDDEKLQQQNNNNNNGRKILPNNNNGMGKYYNPNKDNTSETESIYTPSHASIQGNNSEYNNGAGMGAGSGPFLDKNMLSVEALLKGIDLRALARGVSNRGGIVKPHVSLAPPGPPSKTKVGWSYIAI